MFEGVLTPAAKSVVELLAPWVSRRRFYLSGGTGCALHLGHRMSQDLDFFCPLSFLPGDLWAELRKIGECAPDYTDAGTWVGDFRNTKTGFFHYPYPLLEQTVPFSGLAVASLKDIACMKIEAVAGRGKKRDFIDLYFILGEMGFDLEGLLGLFRTKYHSVPGNRIHVMKSLTYFVDADSDPDPVMLVEYSWVEVKKKLTELVVSLALS
jgi:hypothetical protein